jgi:hypothetical protein
MAGFDASRTCLASHNPYMPSGEAVISRCLSRLEHSRADAIRVAVLFVLSCKLSLHQIHLIFILVFTYLPNTASARSIPRIPRPTPTSTSSTGSSGRGKGPYFEACPMRYEASRCRSSASPHLPLAYKNLTAWTLFQARNTISNSSSFAFFRCRALPAIASNRLEWRSPASSVS